MLTSENYPDVQNKLLKIRLKLGEVEKNLLGKMGEQEVCKETLEIEHGTINDSNVLEWKKIPITMQYSCLDHQY